jgi:L-serine dehydratase
MKAGHDFLKEIRSLPAEVKKRAENIEIILYGSLSATGKGHGTDRAVLAGLMGQYPHTCRSDFLDGLFAGNDALYRIDMEGHDVKLTEKSIVWKKGVHNYPFSNTLVIKLRGHKRVLFEKEYYSVGGGFLQWKGWNPPARGFPVYSYKTADELKKIMGAQNLSLHELVMENETAITGMSRHHIREHIIRIIMAMESAVEGGIEREGVLPGPLGLHRKASVLFRNAKNQSKIPDRFLVYLSAYAFAAAEENAAGHRVVTAPTCGAAGVMASIVYTMKHHLRLPIDDIVRGFLSASVVGFLARKNASVAGAEVGCQGEVGVASSMGAAMLAYARTSRFEIMENAAETALEHHLGMTCDPVGGYVQVPCIERNAMGAVKAYTAALIASTETPKFHMIDLDKVIRAMAETGRDMNEKYRETSQGGLALLVRC